MTSCQSRDTSAAIMPCPMSAWRRSAPVLAFSAWYIWKPSYGITLTTSSAFPVAPSALLSTTTNENAGDGQADRPELRTRRGRPAAGGQWSQGASQ